MSEQASHPDPPVLLLSHKEVLRRLRWVVTRLEKPSAVPSARDKIFLRQTLARLEADYEARVKGAKKTHERPLSDEPEAVAARNRKRRQRQRQFKPESKPPVPEPVTETQE